MISVQFLPERYYVWVYQLSNLLLIGFDKISRVILYSIVVMVHTPHKHPQSLSHLLFLCRKSGRDYHEPFPPTNSGSSKSPLAGPRRGYFHTLKWDVTNVSLFGVLGNLAKASLHDMYTCCEARLKTVSCPAINTIDMVPLTPVGVLLSYLYRHDNKEY